MTRSGHELPSVPLSQWLACRPHLGFKFIDLTIGHHLWISAT